MTRRSIRKPEKPFAIDALVPFGMHVGRIVHREQRDGAWVYRLRSLSRKCPWREIPVITHAELLASITNYACYKVGDEVSIDHRFTKFPIRYRQWDFKVGTVFYGITDVKRQVITLWKRQEELVSVARAHQQVLDGPRAPTLEGYSDQQYGW